MQRAEGRADAVDGRPRTPRTETGSRYIDFLIPGLIGVNTMGGGLFGIGFLLVNFRIAKLLKRFMATPMPRRNFLLAVIGARLTFLIPDVGTLLLLGTLGFGMPDPGEPVAVALVEIVGALAFSGIGLLVASRAQTTETVSGLMNLVMIPMWIFSGVFFASDRFPDWLQPFIRALPLTQLVGALRADHPGRGGTARRLAGPADPVGLGRRHLPDRPSASSAGPDARLERQDRVAEDVEEVSPDRRRIRSSASAGTGTSSIRWPKNVALARISTSTNREADCRGIAASFSPGGAGKGSGRPRPGPRTAIARAAPPATEPAGAAGESGRRPRAWSQALIDFRSGGM